MALNQGSEWPEHFDLEHVSLAADAERRMLEARTAPDFLDALLMHPIQITKLTLNPRIMRKCCDVGCIEGADFILRNCAPRYALEMFMIVVERFPVLSVAKLSLDSLTVHNPLFQRDDAVDPQRILNLLIQRDTPEVLVDWLAREFPAYFTIDESGESGFGGAEWTWAIANSRGSAATVRSFDQHQRQLLAARIAGDTRCLPTCSAVCELLIRNAPYPGDSVPSEVEQQAIELTTQLHNSPEHARGVTEEGICDCMDVSLVAAQRHCRDLLEHIHVTLCVPVPPRLLQRAAESGDEQMFRLAWELPERADTAARRPMCADCEAVLYVDCCPQVAVATAIRNDWDAALVEHVVGACGHYSSAAQRKELLAMAMAESAIAGNADLYNRIRALDGGLIVDINLRKFRYIVERAQLPPSMYQHITHTMTEKTAYLVALGARSPNLAICVRRVRESWARRNSAPHDDEELSR